MWKVLNKEVDLGEPTSFLDYGYFGCTQRQCEIKQRYCWQLQNHVWIQSFRKSNWKTTMLGKSVYFFVVLWHGRSCQELCGTIMWVGKQDDTTTLQSINSLHRWPPLQRRRNEICWRIVTCMLSKLFWNAYTCTNWTTWYSMVSK